MPDKIKKINSGNLAFKLMEKFSSSLFFSLSMKCIFNMDKHNGNTFLFSAILAGRRRIFFSAVAILFYFPTEWRIGPEVGIKNGTFVKINSATQIHI